MQYANKRSKGLNKEGLRFCLYIPLKIELLTATSLGVGRPVLFKAPLPENCSLQFQQTQ